MLWSSPPWQKRLYLLAAAFLIIASVRPGESLQELGLSGRSFLRSASVTLLAALAAIASVAAAHHFGVLHAPGSFRELVRRFWGYAIWSLAQQFLLQDFFLLRFRRLLSGRTGLAVALATAIFAAAHLPNPALTLFTAVWGAIACMAFLRFRDLYSLGLAHAILGVTVAICLPGHVTHNMHVGLGYLRYGKSHAHRRVSDQTVSTRV